CNECAPRNSAESSSSCRQFRAPSSLLRRRAFRRRQANLCRPYQGRGRSSDEATQSFSQLEVRRRREIADRRAESRHQIRCDDRVSATLERLCSSRKLIRIRTWYLRSSIDFSLCACSKEDHRL